MFATRRTFKTKSLEPERLKTEMNFIRVLHLMREYSDNKMHNSMYA